MRIVLAAPPSTWRRPWPQGETSRTPVLIKATIDGGALHFFGKDIKLPIRCTLACAIGGMPWQLYEPEAACCELTRCRVACSQGIGPGLRQLSGCRAADFQKRVWVSRSPSAARQVGAIAAETELTRRHFTVCSYIAVPINAAVSIATHSDTQKPITGIPCCSNFQHIQAEHSVMCYM